MQHLQGQLSSQQEQMQAAEGLQVELHTTRQSLNAVLQAEAEKAEELGTFREWTLCRYHCLCLCHDSWGRS